MLFIVIKRVSILFSTVCSLHFMNIFCIISIDNDIKIDVFKRTVIKSLYTLKNIKKIIDFLVKSINFIILKKV